jgi:hypothetical protein
MGKPHGISPPIIRTTTPRRSAVIPSPLAQVISRPVPPFSDAPVERHARVAEATEMLLAADRTNYLVSENEFPTYTVSNAVPNQPIVWSLWLNGIQVVKDQTFGAVTNNEGNWFGIGSAWTIQHVGFWVVLASTPERQARVRFLVSADLGHMQPTPPKELLGVTHVGGLYRFATLDSELTSESFLVEGAKHIRNLGAAHFFGYLSPQYRSDYSFDDFGEVDHNSLTSLAASSIYPKLFNLPFDTFVLTAYTFANWDWIQSRGKPDAVPFNTDSERAELAELVRHLAAAYPSKRFILKNWEGDWQMKISYDPNAVASEQQVGEFIAWMKARQDGVSLGRNPSQSSRVQHAIEFNQTDHAQRGVRSMLVSVIPAVESDLIAYSSWWSLARPGSLARNIRDDVAFIRNLPGIRERPLIVSEFGFSFLAPELGQRTMDAVEAFSSEGIRMAFYWEIFDNGPDVALVGPQATRFESWHRLRAFLGVRNEAAFVLEESRLPQRLVAGQRYPVTIAVRNSGNLFDPVVGYALGLADAQGNLEQVVWVHREVPVGDVITLDFALNTPSKPGAYAFRMFQHGVEFFGEELRIEVHDDQSAVPHSRS